MGGQSAQVGTSILVAGAFGESFPISSHRHSAGARVHRSQRDVGSSEDGGAASYGEECGQDAQAVGTQIAGLTAALRPRLVKVEKQQPSAGTSL